MITFKTMQLPYTNQDVLRTHHMNMRYHNACKRLRNYFTNLVSSTKNAAKLLCASVTLCIHGIFPKTFKYTPLSICLSIVENDLINNKQTMHAHEV